MENELTWTPDVARLDSLELWARNPKRMSKTRAERLLQSWRDMGQYQTLAVGPGGECYDGTQRVNTLKAAGYKGDYEVRVLRSNRALTDSERERLIIESTVGTVGALDFDALSGWDNTALQTFGLDAEALAEWNDAAANLREMLTAEGATAVDAEPQMDRAEELQEKWQVKTGDVWQCGQHFIICGDCRDPETWTRLLTAAGVDKVNVVFTSPPYWVGKDYEEQFTWETVQEFIAICAAIFTKFVFPQSRIIINTGTCQAGKLRGGVAQMRLLLDDWQREFEVNGWLMRYVRFWAKRGGLPLISPDMDVIDVHTEFIGYFYNPKNKPFSGQRRVGEKWATDGLWDDIQGTRSASGHEAAFPVEIARRNILLFSDAGDVILDPFAGSGTTIVAAHNEKRRGLGIEKLEKYVSVCLERLTVAFGITPVRLG